ncbi:MAG: lipid-A-disaccharide synthase [Dongiaceae bacterium]
MNPSVSNFTVALIAGEPSGDYLGARLMGALKAQHSNINFIGIGGPLMQAQGLQSFFPYEELALMGLVEIIPHIRHLQKRIQRTADYLRQINPAALITIDSPGFNKRVVKKIGKGRFPLIHYVAPSVWAWRPGRAKVMAKLYDAVLCLLPFEPPYFERAGMKAYFIGHPIVESGAGIGDAKRLRQKLNINPNAKVICLLPGSRKGEIARHMPLFRQTMARLQERYGQVVALLPTLPHLQELIAPHIKNFPTPLHILTAEQDKHDAFALSQIALAASGTVTLELALAGLPHVVVYRVNWLTALIARQLVKTPWITLSNILLQKNTVPEYIQERATPHLVTEAIAELLDNPTKRMDQIASLEEASQKLKQTALPSEAAAKAVLSLMKQESLDYAANPILTRSANV